MQTNRDPFLLILLDNKRKLMKLTYQKVVEIGPMQVRISFLLDRVYTNYPHNWHEIVMNNQKELNDYKIRLENLLCETDDKEKYNK